MWGEIDRVSDITEGLAAHVDYDSEACVLRIPELHSRLRAIGVAHEAACYSKSRRGWHLSLVLTEKLERAELIALQLVLGDDVKRGALNLMRVIQIRKHGIDSFWSQRHNILYKRKLK